jgi:glutamate receptor, ionotropic, invertebrate
LALGLPNVGGVFILLMVGGFAAIIVNILEMVSDVVSRSRELKVPFKTELTEELKFVCQCTGNTKPVRNRKSSSSESQATTASKKSSLSNSLDSVKETKESKSTTKNDSKKSSKTPKKDDLKV